MEPFIQIPTVFEAAVLFSSKYIKTRYSQYYLIKYAEGKGFDPFPS